MSNNHLTINNQKKTFFTIKTRDEIVAKKINNLRTQPELDKKIYISNLNVLKDKIHSGDFAFIVLGGDRKPWINGLVALACFDKLHNTDKKVYEAELTIKLILPQTLTQKDYLPFPDTTDAINIGPSIKGSLNQAITSIAKKPTLFVLAGIITYFPETSSTISKLIGDKNFSDIQDISNTHYNISRVDFEGDEDLLDDIESEATNTKREYIAASRVQQKDLIRIEKQELQINSLYERYQLYKKKANPEKRIKNLDDFEDTLVLSPDFQRNYVWKSKQKKELIESILLGIPLPAFYFSEDENGNLLVVDGKQRLTSIFEFMDNQFSLPKDFGYLNETHFSQEVKYSTLQEKIKRKIGSFFLTCYIINPTTPPLIRNEIFTRVNRGGIPLNAQEVRNAVNIGQSTILLENISRLPSFSFIPKTRKKDQYLALRFISFRLLLDENFQCVYNFNNQFKHIDILLDTIMKFINAQNDNFIDNMLQVFDDTLQIALFLFETQNINKFSKKDSKVVNMNIFETWMTILSYFRASIVKDNIEIFCEAYLKLINNNDFDINISVRRDSKEKIEERLNIIKKNIYNIQEKLK